MGGAGVGSRAVVVMLLTLGIGRLPTDPASRPVDGRDNPTTNSTVFRILDSMTYEAALIHAAVI
jgi:hypothetical protein